MPPPKPTHTLLTLPREIRDCIYSYLTHEVPLRTIKELGGNETVVELENAPCLNVMLINSQIYHEYRETCLRKLAANIDNNDPYTIGKKILEVDDLEGDFRYTYERRAELDNEALSKVGLVTVRLTKYPKWYTLSLYNVHCKLQMDLLLLAISEKSPLLHALQVVEYHYVGGLVDVPFGDNDLPEQLPMSFPPMKLKQSVAGRRLVICTRKGSTLDGQMTLFRAVTFSTRSSRVDLWTGCLIFKLWKIPSDIPGHIYAWE